MWSGKAAYTSTSTPQLSHGPASRLFRWRYALFVFSQQPRWKGDRGFVAGCLFQMLVYRLGHLKHVQFLGTEDGLQLVVSQYLPLVLRILQLVLLNVSP